VGIGKSTRQAHLRWGVKPPVPVRPQRESSPAVRFSPDAPPHTWQLQHDRSLFATALGRQVELPTLLRNRPVPRQADCHYFAVDTSSQNFYFY
jgi:hypothetical protein